MSGCPWCAGCGRSGPGSRCAGRECRPPRRAPALDPGPAGAGGAAARRRGAGGPCPARPGAAPAARPTGWSRSSPASPAAAPNLTLRAIGAELARLREKTPRGGLHWSPSSVAHLLERARKAGLVTA